MGEELLLGVSACRQCVRVKVDRQGRIIEALEDDCSESKAVIDAGLMAASLWSMWR